MVEAPNKLLDRARAELHTYDRVGKQTSSELILALFEAERQNAELRASRDRSLEKALELVKKLDAAEAENARLRALPLKDEVERVLERASATVKRYRRACLGDDVFHSDLCETDAAIDALLSRLQAE